MRELKKYGIHPSHMQIWRAKTKALEMIEGSHEESYKLLPKYCLMLIRSNPGSVAKIHFEMSIGVVMPSIKRIFVGFRATKQGFLEGCLPYIGFDGCHLKSPYGGVLLSAIGMDGDNGLYPIAFAVVESENKGSWLFFFEWLAELLDGFPAEKMWTFMTDRQKGLIEAIAVKVPHAINRKCCRHIFSNFRNKFPPLLLRKLFWVAARAYTVQGFNNAMDRIKNLRPEAYTWLDNIGAEMWARHAFPHDLKNNHITNNPSESFNSWVEKLRDQPILSLLEGLRNKVMRKLQKRYASGCQWEREVVPRVVDKLRKATQNCRTLSFVYGDEATYQVREENTSYIVNIESRSCDCKVWDLTGIPCIHAVVVLLDKRQVLENYCHRSLTKGLFLQAYSHLISPIPDVTFWPQFRDGEAQEAVPPLLRRRVGRPKVNRRREEGETSAAGSKRSSTGKCGKCKQFGHNARTCAGGPTKRATKTQKLQVNIV